MKFKYILASLVAAAAMLVGCTEEMEPVAKFEGLTVSNDNVTIEAAEGSSATITVTGDEDWTAAVADEKADWLTISPASGAAGQEVTVTFTATASTAARNVNVNITVGSKTKIISVSQKAPEGVEVAPSTCAEVIAGENITYKVVGTVTSIVNTSYGNWYLADDTGEIYIYGTFNSKSQYPKDADGGWAGFGIEVGDKVEVEGPKTVYNGTVELVDVSYRIVEKSLIDASFTTNPVSPAAGKDTLNVSSKVQPVLVTTDADWVKITDFTDDGNYVLEIEENLYSAPRTANFSIKAPGAIKSLSLTQEGVPANGASITDIIAQQDGSVVETLPSTVVVALTTRGAVLSDGTSVIYAYGTDAAALSLGDGVKMNATKTTYNGVPELTDITAVFVDSQGNAVSHPTAKDITSEAATYTASTGEYVKLSGTLAVSGNYYNITLDGIDAATKQGSITYPVDALNAKSFDGQKITVTGYFNGLSSGGKFINIIATKIDEFTDNPKGTATNPYSASEIAAEILSGNIPSEDVYIKGIVSAVLYTASASYPTCTFWISDDGTAYGIADDKKSTTEPSKDFECYSVYWFDNANWAEGNGQVSVGDEVVVCGKTTAYNGIAETSSKKAWLYSVNYVRTAGVGLGSTEFPFNVAGAEEVIDYQQEAIAAAKAADEATPVFRDVCVGGKISAILYTFSASYGTGTFWISDDGTAYGIASDKKSTTEPTKDFECYSVLWYDNQNWTDSDPQPAVGDEVVVKGQLTKYGTTYETSSKKAWVCSYTAAAV